MGNGGTEFANRMNPFLNDFSLEKKDLADNFIETLTGTLFEQQGFELFLGKAAGAFLKNLAEEAVNAIKEATTNMKDFVVDQLKKEDPTQDEKAKGVSALLGAAVINFKSSMSAYVEHLQSGKTGGPITKLRNVLKDGNGSKITSSSQAITWSREHHEDCFRRHIDR